MVFKLTKHTYILVHAYIYSTHFLGAITRCKLDPEITKKLMDNLRVMELLQRNANDPDNAMVKPNTMTYW